MPKLNLSPEVLDELPPIENSNVDPGFVLDESGVRTQRRFRGGAVDSPGVFQRAPRDSWEWIPLVWSVLTAADKHVSVELGAGWGPWISRCHVLANRTGRSAFVYGVEAEPNHFDYLQTHLIDNGVPESEKRLFQGLIAARSGVALFPLTETPEKSWGLRKVGQEGQSEAEVLEACKATPVEGEDGLYNIPKSPHRYRIERSISLAELIGDEPSVDFMHVDIQGSEGEVLPDAMDLLSDRFKLVAVGTHSHEIEAILRDAFASNGWECHHDSIMHHDDKGMLRDGHQVWSNPRLIQP